MVRFDELILGDLGNPHVDARILTALLLREGKVAEWLRSHAIELEAIVRDFPGSDWK